MSAPALIGLGILVGIVVGGLLVWFWVGRKAARLEGELNIERALSEERDKAFKLQLEQIEANKSALKIEFENLSRELLAARGKELVETNSNSLSAILKPLSEKIDGFQHRVNQVHSDMIQNSASLIQQIKQLETVGLTMSADAQHLTEALKGDKKLVGNWGETQLERTLELAGLRAGEHYDSQASFKDEAGKRYLPDFVIRLPEGKNLVVDSKVSLVDYEAAVAADAEPLREAALKRHGEAVKAHIDNLASKAYQQLPGLSSPDFVMMFMPVEPAYIEVMRNHRDLFAYGYQKGVVMVSHSTLMPILRTVANLWMVERSNEEAREISARAGEIFNSVSLVAERLASLGGSLQTASKKYNEAVTALTGRQGLQGKVERFQSLSAKATRPFPEELRPIITENDRLQLSESKEKESTEPSSH